MGRSVAILATFFALMTFCDQRATGINNTNVQREVGPVSQLSLCLFGFPGLTEFNIGGLYSQASQSWLSTSSVNSRSTDQLQVRLRERGRAFSYMQRQKNNEWST